VRWRSAGFRVSPADYLSAFLAYQIRVYGYGTLLGDQQGRDFDPTAGAVSATRPLILTGGAQGLLVLFIVLGVLSYSGVVGSALHSSHPRSMSVSSGTTLTRVRDAGTSPHDRPQLPAR
jgi:hypothetical protein